MVKLRDIGRLVRDAWLVVGVTMLLFCLLEGGISLATLIGRRLSGSEQPALWDTRYQADTYAGRSWAREYYAELQRAWELQWTSYVYYRRKPFHGTYINVDTNGLRATTAWTPPQREQGTSVKIFVFGGSTLWGTGARDAYTIPSLLARELRKSGLRPEITNFGETGYVSTQEVITLLLQLRNGHHPDIAIFYDGVNDTFSAYQQGVAGLPMNEGNRATEFNLSRASQSKRRRAMVVRDVVDSLSTVRLLTSLLRRSGALAEPRTVAGRPPRDDLALDTGSAGGRVVDMYLGNVQLVTALGEHYHFKSLFYWQPTIFQKEHLTSYERKERSNAEYMAPFVGATYAAMRRSLQDQQGGQLVRDLSPVFSGVREPIFIDWHHLGESGNEIIARTVAGDILRAIAAGAAERGAASGVDSGGARRKD
jgi:hypothetical protein